MIIMKKLIVLMIALFVGIMAEAQNIKENRVKEIRTAYAQAKKKIDMNGKGGKSRKDMHVELNQLIDEDIPLYDTEAIDFYFDETITNDIVTKHPYFIIENWSNHGHLRYREILLNPKNQQVMFCYMRGETDGGFVVESRYYYDNKGQCVEAKHNTDNSWTTAESEKEKADFYLKAFNMINNRNIISSTSRKTTKLTSPKTQRINQIRSIYAQAKEKIEKNNKNDFSNDFHITIHEFGDDRAPRTRDTKLYFDKECYFISNSSKSMMYEEYNEYLFAPQSTDLIFSYTHSSEEGETFDWRYYYDENGKCIETKTNSEETDAGSHDKSEANALQTIFHFMLDNPD